MVIDGEINDGQISLDPACALPQGAKLKVIVLPQTEATQPKNHWEEFFAKYDEAVKDVPAEEWEKLPADGAINHDHYLYGAPKRKVD